MTKLYILVFVEANQNYLQIIFIEENVMVYEGVRIHKNKIFISHFLVCFSVIISILYAFRIPTRTLPVNDKDILCFSASQNAFLMTMLIYISTASFQTSYLTVKFMLFNRIKIISKSLY